MSFNPVHYVSAQQAQLIIPKTFYEAATSYLEEGSNDKYIKTLLPYIGDKMLLEIFPYDMMKLADRIYPTQANATKNRCVITPIRAVFNHAYERGWHTLMKFKSFKQEKPKARKPASPLWIHAFIRQCEKDKLLHIAALIMFMSQTGARVSEALNLRWDEVDLAARTALLLKTKTSRNSLRFLTSQMSNRLLYLSLNKKPEYDNRVFQNKDRTNINSTIKNVCKRAEIEYKSCHVCGRYAYANNALDLGLDIKSIMDGGGWVSVPIFLGTYVQRKNGGRTVADKFDQYNYDSNI